MPALKSDNTPVWWDAHTHLHDPALAVYGAQMGADLASVGVGGGMICGTCPRDWPMVVKWWQAGLPGDWWASFGVHPWRVMGLPADWRERLETVLDGRHPVGEIGLDRWIQGVDFETQEEIFAWQWGLAARCGLPVTVHCLRAWGDLRTFLGQSRTPEVPGFLLHAYSGPPDQVAWWVERGAYFSFSGSFLDRPKKMEAFRRVPVDRLLIETDAPAMLPPERFRFTPPGHPKESSMRLHHPCSLPACAKALAEWLGWSPDELAGVIKANFYRLFRLG